MQTRRSALRNPNTLPQYRAGAYESRLLLEACVRWYAFRFKCSAYRIDFEAMNEIAGLVFPSKSELLVERVNAVKRFPIELSLWKVGRD